MSPEYVSLSYAQVGLAALLIVVNGVLSILLKLDLGWRLLTAAARMVVQLLLVGFVLGWVFSHSAWYTVVAVGLVMVAVAGVAAVQRTERRYPGIWLDGIVSVWASSWLITAVGLLGIVQVTPWYQPQYAIPLLGMILGNTLSGISLGLDRMGEELVRHRAEVEALLTLGASRWEAARLPVRRAVRTGMVPMINAMTVAGIVSLPGMMTGQLLAGVDPVEAVKYQVVILFLIAAATALGTVGAVLLCYRRLFNARHQFLYGLLAEKA
jgi:putative ABC transport system permease protein